jgi:hypothetical protein
MQLADAGRRPCGRIFTSADGKNCPRVKSCPWDKRGRVRMSGRRSRTFGRPDGKFYRRMSI